jgi:MoaA/NifB/PqqE/SkfB family radical SAM enzyme
MSKEWQGRDMDMRTFARLKPLMNRAARVHLQGWGEPFLNADFFTMAAMARRAGCKISTTTCGLGMDTARADAVVASGLDIVAFSLVGTEAAGNAQRHGVDFEHVCQGISTLRDARRRNRGSGPAIHLAYLLLASNSAAVTGLPTLMQRLGVGQAVISTLDYLPEPTLQKEAFLPGERAKIEKTAALLKATAAEAGRLGLAVHHEFPRPESSGNGCRENIDRSLFVSAAGDVSPCVFVNFPAPVADARCRVMGNVLEQDPLAIWERAEYRLFRDRLRNGDPDLPCQSCPKRFHPEPR